MNRTESRVNAGRSKASIVGLGLVGLLGIGYLLWPKPPAVVHGEPTAYGSTWELRGPEHKAILRGETMGTTFAVILVVDDVEAQRLDQVLHLVDLELDHVNAEMSTYLEDSALSRFNAAASTEPIAAPRHLLAVIEDARHVSEATGGAFDVTVGPLVDAWGFGPDRAPHRELDEAEIDSLRSVVGYDKLEVDLDRLTLRKSVPGLHVDLSAIAKGHGCDRVGAVVEAQGFVEYMVEIGGEIRTRGNNPRGEPWKVGVERPTTAADGARVVQSILPVSNAALATSGDYRNYWEKDGVRYSHTVDPRTGRPIAHTLASVTVVHPESTALADAWATALNVLGPDEGLAIATREGLAAYFLVRHGDGFDTRSTPAFEALIP